MDVNRILVPLANSQVNLPLNRYIPVLLRLSLLIFKANNNTKTVEKKKYT